MYHTWRAEVYKLRCKNLATAHVKKGRLAWIFARHILGWSPDLRWRYFFLFSLLSSTTKSMSTRIFEPYTGSRRWKKRVPCKWYFMEALARRTTWLKCPSTAGICFRCESKNKCASIPTSGDDQRRAILWASERRLMLRVNFRSSLYRWKGSIAHSGSVP